MDEIEIEKEPKDCYSYVGKFSMEKIMYLLDRKSHIDKKLSKKKKTVKSLMIYYKKKIQIYLSYKMELD